MPPRTASHADALLLRLLAVFAVQAAVGSGVLAAPANPDVPTKPVTARPPHEAVPATPARMHRCNSAAASKQLHGSERSAFIKSCLSESHHQTAPPARKP
jgi:hypothetical protein